MSLRQRPRYYAVYAMCDAYRGDEGSIEVTLRKLERSALPDAPVPYFGYNSHDTLTVWRLCRLLGQCGAVDRITVDTALHTVLDKIGTVCVDSFVSMDDSIAVVTADTARQKATKKPTGALGILAKRAKQKAAAPAATRPGAQTSGGRSRTSLSILRRKANVVSTAGDSDDGSVWWQRRPAKQRRLRRGGCNEGRHDEDEDAKEDAVDNCEDIGEATDEDVDEDAVEDPVEQTQKTLEEVVCEWRAMRRLAISRARTQAKGPDGVAKAQDRGGGGGGSGEDSVSSPHPPIPPTLRSMARTQRAQRPRRGWMEGPGECWRGWAGVPRRICWGKWWIVEGRFGTRTSTW